MEKEKDSFNSAVEKRLSPPAPMPAPMPAPVPAKPVKKAPEENQKQRNEMIKGYIDDVSKTFGISAQIGLDLFANDPEQKKGAKMYIDVYGKPVVEVTTDGLLTIDGQTYSVEDSKLLRDNMRNYYQSLKTEAPQPPATPTPAKPAPVKSP